MNTLLSKPLIVDLPSNLVPLIRSHQNQFFFDNIKLELRSTTLKMVITNWKAVETATTKGVDLKEYVKFLEMEATKDCHKMTIMMLKARYLSTGDSD